jgi:hypothetical protein
MSNSRPFDQTSTALDDERILGPGVQPAIRAQAAVVRALLDVVEWSAPDGPDFSPTEQVIEEMTRLGYRLLAMAAAWTAACPAGPPDESGVFTVGPEVRREP